MPKKKIIRNAKNTRAAPHQNVVDNLNPAIYFDLGEIALSSNNATFQTDIGHSGEFKRQILKAENGLLHNTVKFSDALNTKLTTIMDAGRGPAFSVIKYTNGVNDEPFSVSFWYNRDTSFANSTAETLFRFGPLLGVNGSIVFKYDNSSAKYFAQIYQSSTQFLQKDAAISSGAASPNDAWVHIVMTFNGTTSSDAIQIYVNGVSISGNTTQAGVGTYTVSPVQATTFGIANGVGDGYFAQFAWFKNKLLNLNEVLAIYNSSDGQVSSGFLNNPVKTVIRDQDNRSGIYPTVHRMNRKGTEGILSNVIFNDNHTVRYGTSIKDDFELRNVETNIFTKEVDSKKWIASDTAIRMRKEIFEAEDVEEITRGLLVFGGAGDSEGRWIQTREKVSKPTLFFSLVQGPYNTGAESQPSSLKLYQGTFTDTFAVQVSTTGIAGDWTTIEMIKEFISSNASPNLINSSGKFIMQPPDLVMSDVSEVDGTPIGSVVTNQTTRRPMFKVKVDMHAFSSAGFKEPFYIRLIQESVSNVFQPNWAVADIKIISRDQQVTYPHLGIGDTATLYHLSKSIATPNFINSITTTGSSIAGVSDTGITTINEQNHTPFSDDTTFLGETDSFYTQGVSPIVTPGFSNTLFSKTFFDLNLSTASVDDELQIGINKPSPNTPSDSFAAAAEAAKDDGQMLMAYWNFDLKRWQKIGTPFLDNRGNNAGGSDLAAVQRMRDIITGSCLGFGPTMPIVRGTSDTDMTLFPPEVMEYYGRPIHTYGFPFAAKYHATSSQTIRASDLGITKPMLLEKCIYDLNLDFEIPSDDSAENPTGRYAYNAYYFQTSTTLYKPVQRLKIYQPTFFILTQRTKYRPVNDASYGVGVAGYNNAIGNQVSEIIEGLPKTVKLISGSNEETTVYDTREMITYGQYNLFVTASNTATGVGGDNPNYTQPHDCLVSSSISMDDILSSGITREAYDVVQIADTNPIPGVSEVVQIRNKKMNVPVKITNKHDTLLRFTMWDNRQSTFGDFVHPILDHKMMTREFSISGGNRAIVNGSTSLKSANKQEQFVGETGVSTATIPLSKTLQNISPYIVYPEDELIFGVQYPVSWDMRQGFGGIGGSADAAANNMKLLNTKIRLIGSQIKNGKEFHEGLNQNLTSNSIYEVIGAEPVIDQWEIANSGELSGSYVDDYFLGRKFRAPGVDSGTGSDILILGRLIPPEEKENLSQGFTSDTPDKWQLLLKEGINPVKRVSSRYDFTLEDRGIFSSVVGLPNSLLSYNNRIGIFEQPGAKYVQQTQRFASSIDTRRTFSDARILNLNLTEQPFTYGSYQNYTFYFPIKTTDDRRIRVGGFPKYYYSSKHYGHLADNVRQGLDGKFEAQPLSRLGSRDFTVSPISIKFVNEQTISDGSALSTQANIRAYVQIQPSDIDGTAYETFQSSNISLFATSSLPFFDDDTPRNRTYAASVVEVS